jgi:hypothetical protein
MKVNFPLDCSTEASRLSFCYRAQELLRIQHNETGAEFKASRITKAEWKAYMAAFEEKSEAIIAALLAAQQEAMSGEFWNPDLERDIT